MSHGRPPPGRPRGRQSLCTHAWQGVCLGAPTSLGGVQTDGRLETRLLTLNGNGHLRQQSRRGRAPVPRAREAADARAELPARAVRGAGPQGRRRRRRHGRPAPVPAAATKRVQSPSATLLRVTAVAPKSASGRRRRFRVTHDEGEGLSQPPHPVRPAAWSSRAHPDRLLGPGLCELPPPPPGRGQRLLV